MNSPTHKTLPPNDRVTPAELEQALMHWDELDETSLRVLAEHPLSSQRLAGLRLAEEWLMGSGQTGLSEASPALQPCPSAEELFDFALEGLRPTKVQAHVEGCAECAELLASLSSRPPSPLFLVPDEEETAESYQPPRRHIASWAPLAMAAGLVGITIIPMLRSLTGMDSPLGYPEHALVRASQETAALFPRGLVLADAKGARPEFALPPTAGASAYRVQVFQFAGSAFEQGEEALRLESTTPTLSIPLGQGLEVGFYSWQAVAEVRGLERSIHDGGEFQVVRDPELSKEIEALLEQEPIQETSALELIQRLEAKGFSSDARQLAARLPLSAERDAYLRGPGR